MSSALKTATSVVGLLAGLVAGLYVVGGLVIALRLLFDSFSLNEIVIILGQLPRELVISTAMLDVLLLAATVGLVVGLVVAVLADVKKGISLRDSAQAIRWWEGVVLVLVTAALVAPAALHARQNEAPGLAWASIAIGAVATLLAAYAGWYALRKVGHARWEPGLKLIAAGGLIAAVALIPALLSAGSLRFPHAQVCVSDSPVAVRGLLIGEGGGRVLLEQHQASEAGIIALPSDHVTKTEYGDLTSSFVCPLPGGQTPAKVAEAALEGHGSARERLLAMKVRPHLLFDGHEPWRPLEVERFVSEQFPDREGHKACWDSPQSRCEPVAGLSQLQGRAAPDYLDIHGERENGTDYASPHRFCHTTAPPAADCNGGAQAAIYYRRTTHEGHWYWDYWWFFRYNDYAGSFNHCNQVFCGDHEGDWEGVTVVTMPSLTPEIVAVVYAAHRNRILVEGSEAPLEDGHPLVFVAAGTHASYPYRCSAGCRQYASVEPFGRLSEDPHDGAVSWGGNEDADCLKYHCVRPLPEVGKPSDLALPRAGGWAGWPGQWGRTCHEGCESFPHLLQASPRSPGTQIRFKCPWVPTDRALPGPGTSGLSRSEPLGDTERQLAACASQRGGL